MKKIRKALVMSNGVAVHSLEELNDNWDIESVYRYYLSRELLMWLKDRYYLDQFDKLSCVNCSDEEFVKKTLCELFNHQYTETCNKEVASLSDEERIELDISGCKNNFAEIDEIKLENKSEISEIQRTEIESGVIDQSVNEMPKMAPEEIAATVAVDNFSKINEEAQKEDEQELFTQSQCEDCMTDQEEDKPKNDSKDDICDKILNHLEVLGQFAVGTVIVFAAVRWVLFSLFNFEIVNKYTVWILLIAGGMFLISLVCMVVLGVYKIIVGLFKYFKSIKN